MKSSGSELVSAFLLDCANSFLAYLADRSPLRETPSVWYPEAETPFGLVELLFSMDIFKEVSRGYFFAYSGALDFLAG